MGAFASEHIKLIFTYENQGITLFFNQFTEETGIELEWLYFEQSDLKVSMLELLELGNAPDIVIIPSDQVGLYKMMQYSTVDPTKLQNPISEELWRTVTTDKQIYGIPIIQGNHMQRPDIQLQIWQELQAVPVEPNAYSQATSSAAPLSQQQLLTLKHAKAMPSESAMTFAWSAMRKGYIRFQQEVMNAKEAAELMQSLAQSQLESY